MSVLLETSVGDLVLDLETELCPRTCQNFLALCKTYRYNFNAFFNIQKDFIAQTGDPTDLGTGGTSAFHLLPSSSPSHLPTPYFTPEILLPAMKHSVRGTLSMAVAETGNGQTGCASQFFFTLADNITFLDGKHAPFGRVIEGFDTLDALNETFVDNDSRPLRDVRIRHVVILDDPFPELEGINVPPQSPVPTAEQLKSLRVGDDEELAEDDEETTERKRRERDARAQALTLEMVGDLPFADVRPPENVLFVCKLNAVTKSEDLELIFSRFGKIFSCEIITDRRTGDSLQYAFIEFDKMEDAERAYFKMDNVLIDDRRIHVDFSQSVSKLHSQWIFGKTGGKPPPNKGGGYYEREVVNGHSPDHGRGPTKRSNGNGNFVFDMEEVDRDHKRRRRSRSPERRREQHSDRDRNDRPRDHHRSRDHGERGHGSRDYDAGRSNGGRDRDHDRKSHDDRRREDRHHEHRPREERRSR